MIRIGFQPGDELLEVLDLGRDGRADENTELEPRELADRNEILGRCRSKRRHPDRDLGRAGTRCDPPANRVAIGVMNIHAMMVNAHSRKFLGVPCNRPRRHSFYSG